MFALVIREHGVLRHITGYQGPLQGPPSLPYTTIVFHTWGLEHLGLPERQRERDSLDLWWEEV